MSGTTTREAAEALLLRMWPDDDLPEAEHAAQVVTAYDECLREQGIEPTDPWISRWQQARVVKALIDGRLQQACTDTDTRPGRVAAVTVLASGEVVMDAGGIGCFRDVDQARDEATARGFNFPNLPALLPVAPVLPIRGDRWVVADRQCPRSGRSAATATPEVVR